MASERPLLTRRRIAVTAERERPTVSRGRHALGRNPFGRNGQTVDSLLWRQAMTRPDVPGPDIVSRSLAS